MSELISKGDLSSRKKFPRVQNRAGKVSGLAFLVDPDLEEYFCTASDSTGFRVIRKCLNFTIILYDTGEHKK